MLEDKIQKMLLRGRGLPPIKIKKAQKPKAPKKKFGTIPPARTEQRKEEHFLPDPGRPIPIAVQAMQAIRCGEIETGRSNFDRDFPVDQYSIPLQGPDITPPRLPNLGYMEPGDYRDEYIRGAPKQSRVVYEEDDIPVKTGKKRFAGHTVTFIFGLSLLGIVFLGFYFGKKKPAF